MSDPIAEYLYKLGKWDDRRKTEYHAKQIRQQIGRELLDNEDISEDVEDMWWVDRINKICNLEES